MNRVPSVTGSAERGRTVCHRAPRIDRRRFLAGCAACAGCTCGSLFTGANRARAAVSGPAAKARVRLVFCETSNDKPIWPNIGYDFDARRRQLEELLARACPEVEFLPARLMDQAAQADEVLAGDGEVDGYLLCLQGLGWGNDVGKLGTTGKATLVVDNLFGGSGLFLTRLPALLGTGKPVDWVSSSRDEDIAASARCFRLLKEGKSAAETAAAFRAARRERTPAGGDRGCADDKLESRDLEAALAELRATKLLVIGGGWGGDAFRKAAAESLGVRFVALEFAELAAAHAAASPAEARAFAERWLGGAKEVRGVDRPEMERSGAMYVAMKNLLDKHGARGISINCLGGFYGGHLKAYPCLGFCQLNDDGMVGGCEADQMSALTMAVMGTLSGRPGYISDPVIDTSRNAIVYAHCVAMTKPFGPGTEANDYQILTHSEDRHGASLRSLLPAGYLTTTLEIDPVAKEVLFHQAKTTGNNPSDMACRTKLEAVVKGDLEKLAETWRKGWHRVTFYGDLRPQAAALCGRMGWKLVEEA